MFNKAHYKALGLVGLLTIVLVFCLPKHTAAQIKLTIGSLFLPLFGLSRSTSQVASDAGDAIIPRRELLHQIEDLRRRNQILQIQGMQSAAALAENERLHQLVKWQTVHPWRDHLKLAHITARDPANWWQIVHIDLGSRNGVHEDMPVLTSEGLVGRVASVSLTRSQVVLVTNPGCKASAMTDKGREVVGIVAGSASPINNSFVTLNIFTSGSALKPGQTIYTSGAGEVFPAGIPIGIIAEVPRPVDFGRSTEARVKLSANLDNLSEVWVLMTP